MTQQFTTQTTIQAAVTQAATQATGPLHPLVDHHPVDTLAHVQTLLTFAQDFAAKAASNAELTPYEVHTYEGLYALLKTANTALDYEMERLRDYCLSVKIEE